MLLGSKARMRQSEDLAWQCSSVQKCAQMHREWTRTHQECVDMGCILTCACTHPLLRLVSNALYTEGSSLHRCWLIFPGAFVPLFPVLFEILNAFPACFWTCPLSDSWFWPWLTLADCASSDHPCMNLPSWPLSCPHVWPRLWSWLLGFSSAMPASPVSRLECNSTIAGYLDALSNNPPARSLYEQSSAGNLCFSEPCIPCSQFQGCLELSRKEIPLVTLASNQVRDLYKYSITHY